MSFHLMLFSVYALSTPSVWLRTRNFIATVINTSIEESVISNTWTDKYLSKTCCRRHVFDGTYICLFSCIQPKSVSFVSNTLIAMGESRKYPAIRCSYALRRFNRPWSAMRTELHQSCSQWWLDYTIICLS